MFDVHQLMRDNVADRQTLNDGQTGKSSKRLPAFPPEKPPVIPGYDLLGPIASGGMGVIYKALQLRLNRLVAIKVIRPERLGSASAVRRFQREARIAARLAHPNIVPVFDANQTEDVHYLVMEYVEGTDLARLVREQGPLSIERACTCIRQAALGLQHAFEKGLVHRDIKPGNLILAAEGGVRLLDLGLARLREPENDDDRSDSSLTQAGAVLGTPDYMAPEQVEDPHDADIRADLYSLGCTMYFLLTGQLVFPGGSMIQKFDRHRWQPASPVEHLRPDVPPPVAAIVARLLAKKPKERFQTPVELADALEPFAEVERTSAIRRRLERVLPPPDEPAEVRADAAVPPPTGRQMLGHSDSVTGVAFTPDGRSCYSVSRDGTLRSWDAATGGELGRWVVHPGGVLCVVASTDGRRLATGGRDHGLRMWDTASMRELCTCTGHDGEVTCVGFTPDGRQLLSGSLDQTVRLWSVETGRLVRVIGGTVVERHWDGVLSLSLAADGRLALSGSRDKTLRLWNLTTGREVRCLRGPSLPVAAVALSSDGRLALSGGGHTVRLWDVEKGEVLRRLKGHQRVVLSVAFTPDGRRGVSGGEDGTVRIWDVSQGRELCAFVGHTSAVTAIAVAPDGRTVLSGSADRTLALWRLPKSEI
jgi:WD40 repeat protein/tRNA A-37 threonylcarbamoyl transferase component Bud32